VHADALIAHHKNKSTKRVVLPPPPSTDHLATAKTIRIMVLSDLHLLHPEDAFPKDSWQMR